jgi:hypothetical protein
MVTWSRRSSNRRRDLVVMEHFSPRLGADAIEERKVKLRDVMPEKGARWVYEYDFRDG